MRQHHKLLLCQFLVQVFALIGTIYYWNIFNIGWFLIILLGITIFSFGGLCCYYHRYCSHNAFDLDLTTEKVIHYLSILNMQGSVILWSSNHITHHKYSDKDGDPHPGSEKLRTWFWWNTYNNSKLNAFKVKKMLKNPMYKYTHDNYFKLYFAMMFIFILIDPMFTLCFIIIPATYTFYSTSFVNVITHNFGYRNFNTNDKSTNMPLPFLDALHNNHHKYPNRYDTAIKWYEVDFAAALINFYKFIRNLNNDIQKT